MNYYALPGVLFNSPKKNISDLETINRVVADVFNLSANQVKENTRRETVVVARQVAMFMMRKYTKYSCEAIGALYGRDHSTVSYASRAVQNIIETKDYIYSAKIQRVDYLIKINNENHGHENGCETRKVTKYSQGVHPPLSVSS